MLEFLTKIATFFWTILRTIFCCFNLPAIVYDLGFTKPISRYTYYRLIDQVKPMFGKPRKWLDIGVGTGVALHSVIKQIPSDVQITGIDINESYYKNAKKLFGKYKNVEIKLQNFYDMESSNEKYDIIVLGSSFMLMPDYARALNLVKKLLLPGGKIFFLMTLYDKKRPFTEKMKPYLKYYTTIDFGKATYENEFVDLLKDNGLNIRLMDRIKYHFLFKLFRVFIIECDIAK